ncbi:chromosomal replication initiator protein DnaA [Kribbella sp. NPDC051952]|uniref:chromosomal replication initiator protein DnaA n=1 Tax=Kribbella sp. NPDC051952 TaxID=3154851 RepID=UPI00343D5F05
MVEDHSASAEYTPAEYTPARYGPVYTGPQYTGDGGQDLRPDPVADFRTEVAPPEFPTEPRAEFPADPEPEPPTEPRAEVPPAPEPEPEPEQLAQPELFPHPEPEPQPELFPHPEPEQPQLDLSGHLSPSLPIPMPPEYDGYRPPTYPEPVQPAQGYPEPARPAQGYPDPVRPEPVHPAQGYPEPVQTRPEYDGYRYRSDLERAATDLPAGTAYFGTAPAVSNLGYPSSSNTWSREQYPAASTDSGDAVARNEGDARAHGDHGTPDEPQPVVETPVEPHPAEPAPQQQPHAQTAPQQQPHAQTAPQHQPQVQAQPAPQPQQPTQPEPQPQQAPQPQPEPVAPVMDLGDAWSRVLAGLPPNQRAWLTNSRPVTLHESTAIVAVPDDFTRGQLETRLRPDLERILTESFGRDIRIAVTVDPTLDPEVREQPAPPAPVVREPLRTEGAYQPTIQSALSDPDQGPQFSPPRPEPTQPQHYEQPAPQQYAPPVQQPQQQFGQQQPMPNGAPPPHQPTEGQGEARLNPKYTFETFVIGSSNRFAHAAAVAVAEAPGKAYNPQLIYGDSGLGKTHLLHAIGHYVRSLYTGARVRYVSSEEFTNDFINAIRDDKASQFQRRYRDVDVLLIDDIQFLEGKIQTQEEFFHTFNTLHNANKQIVISSDRAPKRLEALEDRLRNRFEWGLITDIQPPDLETRIAILRKKAATERLTAPPEVLEFIASKVQTNIRELEGALIRVTAFASLNRQPVDLSLAEIVLKDLIPEGSKPEVTASMIMGQTASYFGLSIDDLCGSSRSRVLVTARQIAMYLCRELTDLSLPKIGQQFGGRDHTTVMHAERKIRQLMSERRSVFNQVTELTNRIKHQAKQQ